jgi:hypothetical protein
MGASWRCLGAAALLLVLAAAGAPPASAGSAADPEVVDPAGDEAVETGDVPIIPGFNEPDFADVDIVAAWLEEPAGQDCGADANGTCPAAFLTVRTTGGWTTGSMAVAFSVAKGPTSLPGSTASGQAFALTINGTIVAGLEGATAANTPDGLRVRLPLPKLGAIGGDVLHNLTVSTTRTDTGLLQDVEQDDQTGTDTGGPGRAYTFARPPQAGLVRIAVLGGTVDGTPFTGQSYRGAFDGPASVRLQLTNDGLDPDEVEVTVGRPGASPVGTNLTSPILLQPGASRTVTASLVFPAGEELPAGVTEFTFAAKSELGGSDVAVLRVTVPAAEAPPPAEREVKPAGLTFLTSGAQALGLDDAFGSYGEAFLLALIVLLVILAIFLLMALGRSTTRGEPAPEAPWPAERAMPAAFAGPSGLSETVRATPAKPAAEPDDTGGLADFGALAAAAEELAEPEEAPAVAPVAKALPTAAEPTRIRIEEVRHTPREPEAGQRVVTEVILRNDGPAATLRIALGVDGKPAAERTVQVPSRATKAVELPWTAGAGDNRVRIQAFPA